MSEAKVRLAYKLWFFLVVVGLEKGGCEFTHFVLDADKIVWILKLNCLKEEPPIRPDKEAGFVTNYSTRCGQVTIARKNEATFINHFN